MNSFSLFEFLIHLFVLAVPLYLAVHACDKVVQWPWLRWTMVGALLASLVALVAMVVLIGTESMEPFWVVWGYAVIGDHPVIVEPLPLWAWFTLMTIFFATVVVSVITANWVADRIHRRMHRRFPYRHSSW